TLNPEEMIEWKIEMEEYFEFNELANLKKLNVAQTKLKGHAGLWWKEVWIEGNRSGKENITLWQRMVAKLKGTFLPADYELNLLKRLQNLRRKELS
ncbi:hypothetical protein KI387_024483, partial [Taxus chinensis]